MTNYIQILGIIEKINEWNDVLNEYVTKYGNNLYAGVGVIAAILFVMYIGLGALKK